MTGPLRDIDGAAEWLGVSSWWVRQKVTAREIPFTKVGKHVRFTEEHLQAIVAAGEQHPIVTPHAAVIRIPTRSRRIA